MKFFVGLHHPNHCEHFDRAFVSVHVIANRKSGFPAREWIMDSGAFTTINKYGGYPEPVQQYAEKIKRWSNNGKLLAACAQDYMCEESALSKTGLTIPDHQRLTIERYDELMKCKPPVYILPVLQGFAPIDYQNHLRTYGKRIKDGAWVGVGSICKRNSDPAEIVRVLYAVRRLRPDLRLHGFGLKASALNSPAIVDALHTADSMAWSYEARMRGYNANSWHYAKQFEIKINRRVAHAKREHLSYLFDWQ